MVGRTVLVLPHLEEIFMATLSGGTFDSTGGAQQAEELLVTLQKRELIQVHDAAEQEAKLRDATDA